MWSVSCSCSVLLLVVTGVVCRPRPCPPPPAHGFLPWHANRTWQVALASTAVVCRTPCDNTTAAVAIPQLPPLVTQAGDTITFFVDPTAMEGNVSQSITLYQVSEAQFLACDSTRARVISQGFSSYTIFTEDFFQVGNNFIIGESDDESLQCSTGLRINITVKMYSCSRQLEGEPCANRGLCVADAHQVQFSCNCCEGFIGPYCAERDGCYGNPCRNGGFCIDIAEGPEGDTFQCLCPYGYSGKTCEQITHVCDNHPCRNNGTCTGNQTSYQCVCAAGFTGSNCETNINECSSNPCGHGICLDKDDGYQCFCQPGYGGPDCEYEYNECDSSPCINGGGCEDRVGGYLCHCGPGYAGRRCQIKIDLCETNSCPEGRRCVDRGNNYTCECPKGFMGPLCNIKFNACDPNPCINGGTCWNSMNTFFCSCKPGFTGSRCQDVFHLEPLATIATDGNQVELEEIPVTIHLDHLHNIYIAAGTLACAFLIVVIVVTVFHCRVHRTYQRFTLKLPSSCTEVTQCQRYRDYTEQNNDNHVKFSMEIEGGLQPQVSLDALYESSGLEFSDSMEAPLINSSQKTIDN